MTVGESLLYSNMQKCGSKAQLDSYRLWRLHIDSTTNSNT
jgi:hypothetical protein